MSGRWALSLGPFSRSRCVSSPPIGVGGRVAASRFNIFSTPGGRNSRPRLDRKVVGGGHVRQRATAKPRRTHFMPMTAAW